MRRAATIIAWTLLAIGVLIPAAAWWADGDNRRQLSTWFSNAPKQPEEESGIRVNAEPIQAVDVGSALDVWMWKFSIALPVDMRDPSRVLWLVVKRMGKVLKVIGGSGVIDTRPIHCFVSVAPISSGSVSTADAVVVRFNGGVTQLKDNPFKTSGSTHSWRTSEPKFHGSEALLSITQEGENRGFSVMDTKESHDEHIANDLVLTLVLTDSANPPRDAGN